MDQKQQAIKRHYELFELSLVQHLDSIGSLQYSLWQNGKKKVLYIKGSNEPKDWFFNFAYFGVLFHFGYFLLAFKLRKVVKKERDLVVIGHSLGAGVASVLYWLCKSHISEVITIGCPACYSLINPLYPTNLYNYRNVGDGLRWSWITGFRQPRKPTILDGDGHGVLSYLVGFKKKLQKT